MTKLDKNSLFIIDGTYLVYRSFYAIKPLYTSTGVQTQAVYGFVRTIKKLIDEFSPSKLVIAWDSRGKTFRHEMYREYKATRQTPPDELHEQKRYIKEFLDLVGIAQITQEGFEADDVIYALTKEYSHTPIVLVCPDKDLYQVLSDKVIIYDPFKNKFIDKETFEKEEGFPVEKLSFYYSLVGDSSDNIPGVFGIGDKTAKELVINFKSLEDLYEHLDKVPKERTKKLLSEQKENAFLSHELFLLKYNKLPEHNISFDKNKLANALAFFKKFEFTSLIKELEKEEVNINSVQIQETLVSSSSQEKTDKIAPWECVIVKTQESLKALCELLEKSKIIALDTETTGPFPIQDTLVGISFAIDTDKAYYIPVGHTGEGSEKQCELNLVINSLKPILESSKSLKVLHNAKFDMLVFSHYGINIKGELFDTLLAANLIRNAWQEINLKKLSLFFLNEPMTTFKNLLGNNYKTIAQVPLDRASVYGAQDSLQTLKLLPIIKKELDKNINFKNFYESIELPILYILIEMEKTGIILDKEKLYTVSIEVGKELENIERKIFSAIENHQKDLFESEFNLNSPRQIETLLFDELKLPVIKKSAKGQRSTDQEVLEELAKVHPVPGMILKHRELAKLKSTYLLALPNYINPETGKIHTCYSQTMAATGRLSSSEPNLQNIPVSGEFGLKIRSAFVPPKEHLFLSADYSQIELRVLAHMSLDKKLLDAFKNNQDIHTQTAHQLFDVPLDKVTKEQRQIGKKINFSIIYGLTPFGLAKDLGIKQSEAKIYIDKYFAQYPEVSQWIEHTVQEAQKNGYVETLWGRRRYIPELLERNRSLFEAGRRMAINTPVQGTSAEIMKLAMIECYKILNREKSGAKLILQIHDELLIQVPEKEITLVEKLITKAMENIVNWEVPFKVTTRIGKDWEEVTK